MSRLFFIPQAVRIDSVGSPYAGSKYNFYLTGTTTRTDTYQDSALTTPHANPVIADAAGQLDAVYMKESITYRCIITDTDDAQLDDIDPYQSPFVAADIAVTDSGGHFAGAELEAVTQDIGANYGKKSATNTWTQVQTHAAAVAMADNVIERAEMKDYSLTHNILTQSSGTVTLDMSTGNSFFFVLTENAIIAITNPPPSGKLGQLIARIKQDGAGGGFTVTWAASVEWAGGSKPTQSVGNDAVDKYTLTTDDAATSFFGEFGQAYGNA